MEVILALEGEIQVDYDKRNKKKGIKKCTHNYDGQDNLRKKICNFCKCFSNAIAINQKYCIYNDGYL